MSVIPPIIGRFARKRIIGQFWKDKGRLDSIATHIKDVVNQAQFEKHAVEVAIAPSD